jgi:hypothetical protein
MKAIGTVAFRASLGVKSAVTVSGFDQDVRQAAIGGGTKNTESQTEQTVPKVRRALPKDEGGYR